MKKLIRQFISWCKGFFSKKVIATKKPIYRKLVQPGMIAWELNQATGAVLKAEVVSMSWVDKKGRNRVRREVMVKENCLYEFAINGENAVRKFEARILNAVKK